MGVTIDYDACEGSGVCATICPEDVFEHRNGHTSILKPEACTSCWICVEHCVAGAIEVD